jgi:hypothetical protein
MTNAFQSNAFQQQAGRIAFQGVLGPLPPPPPPSTQYAQPPGYGHYHSPASGDRKWELDDDWG